MDKKYKIGYLFKNEQIEQNLLTTLKNDYELQSINYLNLLYLDFIVVDEIKNLPKNMVFICELFEIPIYDIEEDLDNIEINNRVLKFLSTKIEENINKNVNKIDYEIETLKSLVKINILEEKRKRADAGHSFRVAYYSKLLAESLELSESEVKEIYIGALLHDTGKVFIPDKIINKTTDLTEEEYDIVKQHAMVGSLIIPKMIYKNIERIILEHHERYDGSGYPKGLKDEEICLGAKIVALADSFDAMTSVRFYNDIKNELEAIKELEKCITAVEEGGNGIKFDPFLCNLFISIIKKEFA